MDDPATTRVRVIGFVIGLLALYPTMALAVKRLRDRGQPVRYAWLLLTAFAIVLGGDLFGYFDTNAHMTVATWILLAVAAVVLLAFLVELGFRRSGDVRSDHAVEGN